MFADKRTLSLVLAILVAAEVCLGSELTLDACIDRGLARNVSLHRSRLEQTLDSPSSRAAWGQFLPRISLGYRIDQSEFYNQTYLNPDGTVVILPITLPDGMVIPIQSGRRRDSQVFLRVEEVLFDGGQNYLNLKNSGLNRRVRFARLRLAQFNLRTEITRAYCRAISASQRLALATQVTSQRRQQLSYANIRFKTGTVTRRDVLRAEVDLGRALTDSLSASVDVSQSIESLNILLDFPLDSTYEIAALPSTFEPVWGGDSLADAAVENRADLAAGRLNTRIGHNELLVEKGQYLPQLTADLMHSRSEQSGVNVGFTLKPRNRFTSIGLNLSWVMFDRFTRSLRIQDARVRKKQAEIDVKELARQIRQEVISTLNRLQVLHRQTIVASQNEELAEESLEFEQEQYRVGNASVIDLGSAQVSYIQARNDLIRLETDFYMTLGELERNTGLILRNRDE